MHIAHDMFRMLWNTDDRLLRISKGILPTRLSVQNDEPSVAVYSGRIFSCYSVFRYFSQLAFIFKYFHVFLYIKIVRIFLPLYGNKVGRKWIVEGSKRGSQDQVWAETLDTTTTTYKYRFYGTGTGAVACVCMRRHLLLRAVLVTPPSCTLHYSNPLDVRSLAFST